MNLLIDGYNLLHVTGFGGGGGPKSFQRSREELLSFLAASISESERSQTTIVFDAAEAPPGLPRIQNYHGITVRYAAEYADADALIEELIREETSPRSLLVVSSDHRIQRAARRRRATYIDSDRWYSEIWQRRLEAENQPGPSRPDKPIRRPTAEEITYWVEKFSETTALDHDEIDSATSETTKDKTDLANPFPPGYGEDLLRDGF
ncbi:NYN domain-containing protein [Bythopirellula polymerisocia]|uniref:YacP-like NYN domain protein n=1 Tax=Bythopirellula polymerisocia TaxID=2528003 RepID=A0A5C6C6W9_9BACT|nr:NYN domain-containing protein [Bythopirellula polymerisocia]TWU20380.1 YacP-like NYN domain protein [Bythopirellula polymerisocia]